jgi:hypothetical protein
MAWMIAIFAMVVAMCSLIGLPLYIIAKFKYHRYLKHTQQLYEEQRREKAFASMFAGGKP